MSEGNTPQNPKNFRLRRYFTQYLRFCSKFLKQKLFKIACALLIFTGFKVKKVKFSACGAILHAFVV